MCRKDTQNNARLGKEINSVSYVNVLYAPARKQKRTAQHVLQTAAQKPV
jgi:hypothetical protein